MTETPENTPTSSDTGSDSPADTSSDTPAETPAVTPASEETPAPAPAPKAPSPPAAAEAPAPAEEAAAPPPPAPVADAPAPAPKAVKPGTPPDGHWWWGTGRRKAAVARVRIRPGSGKFEVNSKELDVYFTEDRDRNDLREVMKSTNTTSSIDVHVNVRGGGYTGQAGAILLGLGRALAKFDPGLEGTLRDRNYLTRDPRRVERKKYGQRGARRRFQFSKR